MEEVYDYNHHNKRGGAYKAFIAHLEKQGRTIESPGAMSQWSWFHAGWMKSQDGYKLTLSKES